MNGKTYDLLTLGEVLMRLSPERERRFQQCDRLAVDIGGAEANVAAGAAALGLRAGLVSKLPAHAIGEMAVQSLRKTGVDLSWVLRDEDPRSRLGIYYYEKAASPRKPRVVYDRGGSSVLSLRADEFPAEMYESTRCFHTSGITLALTPDLREETVEMIRRFRAGGARISFDVNFRSSLWSGAEARETIEKILPMVDFFFCSQSTADLTFDRRGPIGDVLRSFAEDFDLSVVAATDRTVHTPKRHSFTSYAYERSTGTLFTEEPYADIEVVDRIGSGDAYLSGFLRGMLVEGSVAEAVSWGNAVSALKNTIEGDLAVTSPEEIRGMILAHRSSGAEAEMVR